MSERPQTFWDQAGSLSSIYWISNGIEMFERLAYYGLRTVLPVYMLLAVESGGPQFDNNDKASIYAIWAAIQSFVPVFSGGYADRFGYKKMVVISVILYVIGFLTMGYAIDLASMMTGGASVGVPAHPWVYRIFLAGACTLAFGAAVFKPGLQGLIATQINKDAASFAWGIFYQVVNIGGFLGPILAGFMRILDWVYVFWACAAVASLNLILLALFTEPKRPDDGREFHLSELVMVAVRGAGYIVEPRLFAFLAVFSGFWAMFYQLFDLLPNYIDDWVDSRGIHDAVFVPLFGLFGSGTPEEWGGRVPQEYLINLNSGMIMLLVSFVGYHTGRFRSMTNMVVGILISAAGIWLLGARAGSVVVLAIMVFSIGEMLASPTKMRYMSDIAPPEKKGLYLGFVNATVGIGWTIGSWIAGPIYEHTGDKVAVARRYLIEQLSVDASAVKDIPKTKVLGELAARLQQDAPAVEQLLWDTYDPAQVWVRFMWIGLVSMVGMVAYDQIVRRQQAWEEAALVGLTAGVTMLCYGPRYGAGFAVIMAGRALILRALPALMPERRAWFVENSWLPGSVIMAVVLGGLAVARATGQL